MIDVSRTTFGIILQQDPVWTPNEREDDDDDDDWLIVLWRWDILYVM